MCWHVALRSPDAQSDDWHNLWVNPGKLHWPEKMIVLSHMLQMVAHSPFHSKPYATVLFTKQTIAIAHSRQEALARAPSLTSICQSPFPSLEYYNRFWQKLLQSLYSKSHHCTCTAKIPWHCHCFYQQPVENTWIILVLSSMGFHAETLQPFLPTMMGTGAPMVPMQ